MLIFKARNLNINGFVLHVQTVKEQMDDFILHFWRKLTEFLYHWVKPATYEGFSSTITDAHIWGMVLLRDLSFVNIFN